MRRSPWATLVVLALAQFMVVLDVTIVNVALPDMQAALGFSPDDLQWVISAYTLAFGGFLLLGGRLGDVLGRRRVFAVGLAIFTAASLAGGLATSQWFLVGARSVQGFGGALMSAAALSILTVTYAAGRERNIAMGIWGGLAGLGGTLGVVAGGVLVDAAGWEWVFFVNVPIGVALLLLTPSTVADSRVVTDGPRSFDLAGAALGTGAVLALIYGVIRAEPLGWGSPRGGRFPRRRGRPAGALPADRGTLERTAGAAAALPLPHPEPVHGGAGTQRRSVPRHVLPDRDLPAAGQGTLRPGDRPGVPPDGLRRDRRSDGGHPAAAPPRDAADPGRLGGRQPGRPAAAQPGLGRRVLRHRAAARPRAVRRRHHGRRRPRPDHRPRPRSPTRTPGRRPGSSTPATRSAAHSGWPSSPPWPPRRRRPHWPPARACSRRSPTASSAACS